MGTVYYINPIEVYDWSTYLCNLHAVYDWTFTYIYYTYIRKVTQFNFTAIAVWNWLQTSFATFSEHGRCNHNWSERKWPHLHSSAIQHLCIHWNCFHLHLGESSKNQSESKSILCDCNSFSIRWPDLLSDHYPCNEWIATCDSHTVLKVTAPLGKKKKRHEFPRTIS